MTVKQEKPELVQISAYVRKDHWEELTRLAQENETNPSLELRLIVRDGFKLRERQAA